MAVLKRCYKDAPYSQRLEDPPGTVGTAADTVRCRHCGKKGISAQPQRIRAHLAGVEGQGVTVCAGPPPKASAESVEAYTARRVPWEAARARMKVLSAEAAAEKAAAEARRELDRRTSGAGAAVQQPLFRARNASAAQQAADEKLALAFMIAGWAPHAVENEFVAEALLAVRVFTAAGSRAAARAHNASARAPACRLRLRTAAAFLLEAADARNKHRTDSTPFPPRPQVAAVGPKFVAPKRRELGGVLLDSLHVKTKEKIAAMRVGSSLCGEVLVSDGATNERSEPVLNLLSVSSGCVLR